MHTSVLALLALAVLASALFVQRRVVQLQATLVLALRRHLGIAHEGGEGEEDDDDVSDSSGEEEGDRTRRGSPSHDASGSRESARAGQNSHHSRHRSHMQYRSRSDSDPERAGRMARTTCCD